MEFCAQKGWQVAETYSEEGRSAWVESTSRRPAFRQMLEDARGRKFDVAVTHTLDRFSRNLRVMLDAFHTFSQCDVTYVSITQEIDYSKPEGRLFMTMLGAFAQYFSDALSGHTKKGNERASAARAVQWRPSLRLCALRCRVFRLGRFSHRLSCSVGQGIEGGQHIRAIRERHGVHGHLGIMVERPRLSY